MRYRFLKSAAAAFAVLAAFVPLAAGAAQFKSDASDMLSINGAVNDDLYAAGSSVSLNSQVAGDAVLAGGNIYVSGTVGESVLAAGGTITVLGNAADDLRLVGGNVMVNGNVAHDAVVLAGQASFAPSASVGKDLVVLGGTVTIEAPVGGNLFVRGSEVRINSAIGGSADIKADNVVFGPQASIGGKLVYSSPTEAAISEGLAKGGAEYVKMIRKETRHGKGEFGGLLAIGFFFKLITMIALGLILTAVFKRRSHELEQDAMKGFWMNLLYGFSASILLPIAALVLLVTLIGAPVALVLVAAYGILFALAGILAPVMIGGWIFKLAKKTPDYPVNAYSVIVGAAVFAFVGVVPFFGWVFCFGFMMAALGALARSAAKALDAARNR